MSNFEEYMKSKGWTKIKSEGGIDTWWKGTVKISVSPMTKEEIGQLLTAGDLIKIE